MKAVIIWLCAGVSGAQMDTTTHALQLVSEVAMRGCMDIVALGFEAAPIGTTP